MSTNKFSKYVVENIVTGTQIRSIIPAGALDSAAVIDLIDSDYVAARTPSANGFDSADVIGIVDSDYVQARVTLDGVGIDSATAQSIANSEILSTVDAPYVQARQTPQDFAYSSLTGAPTALSSFTNDTNYITAADIPATVDSDYVAARTPASNGAGLDSAATLDLLSYGIQNVGSNQKQVAISLNTFVDPFDQTGTADRSFNLNYTSTTGMFVRETGGRTEIYADASGTGQSTGLLLTGASFGNNGTEIAGNLKLSSLPTSDPSETGLLWNDGGIPVFSGSTAPSGGGGLDSAGVQLLIDDDLTGSGLESVQIGVDASATGSRGVAVGPRAAATNQNNIAIGNNAGDAGSDPESIAIGAGAKTGTQTGDTGSIAIGAGAGEYFQGPLTVALGKQSGRGGGNAALKQQSGAVAVGYQSGYSEQGENGIAIGREAGWTNQGDNSIGIGYKTGKTGQGANNVSINATGTDVSRLDQFGIDIRTSDSGSVTYSTDSDWVFGATVNAPAFVGDGSGLTGLPSGGGLDSAGVQGIVDDNILGGTANSGVVIGPSVSAASNRLQQTVVGPSAFSDAEYTVVMGRNARVESNYFQRAQETVAIGNFSRVGSSSGGYQSIAIGSSATSEKSYAVTIGANAVTEGDYGVSIGYQASADGDQSTALGYGARVNSGTSSVQVGRGTIAADNAIAISATGSSATTASTQYAIDIRTSDSGSVTYATDSDWVFGATVNAPAFVGDGSGLTGLPSGGGLDSAGVTALINEPYLRDTLYDVATAQTNIGLDAGFASTSNFSIAIGKESGINSGNATNSIALGFKAGQSISDNSIMIGRETGEVGAGSYSVGIGTEALGIGAGAGSVAIGYFASKSSAGSNSVAVGRQASATGDNAIAIGNTVTATTADAVTIGSSVAGRMTYDTTNDWTFGAGVTMTDLTASGVVIFSALPTADPVNAGQLWNDGGTLKVSAG